MTNMPPTESEERKRKFFWEDVEGFPKGWTEVDGKYHLQLRWRSITNINVAFSKDTVSLAFNKDANEYDICHYMEIFKGMGFEGISFELAEDESLTFPLKDKTPAQFAAALHNQGAIPCPVLWRDKVSPASAKEMATKILNESGFLRKGVSSKQVETLAATLAEAFTQQQNDSTKSASR